MLTQKGQLVLATRRQAARRVHCGSSAVQNYSSSTQTLLSWATGKDLSYERLKVEIQQHPQYGRCLVAIEDIQPDEVILSVCTEQVFMSQAADELEMHWAAEMALRLLREKHACQHSSSSSSSSASCSTCFWKPWLDSLPAEAVTPVEFTEREVQQLVLPGTIQAILNMRTCLEDCYEELEQQLQQLGYGWQEFLWAVQVLHSRCFFEPTSQRHLAVPGVDMANHSSTSTNAGVRLIHSPAACQGLAALEEVAPAAAETLAQAKSYFQLLAGPDGIPAGEQVCISYGKWPSEPFLMLFGFVPQPNPDDSIALYGSLQHMGDCYLECAASRLDRLEQEAAELATAAAAAAAGGSVAASSSNMSAAKQQLLIDAQSLLGYSRMLLRDTAFCEAFRQCVQDAELQQQQQQQLQLQQQELPEGPTMSGFTDMIVNQQGIDGRLGQALELLHQAVAAVVEQHLQASSTVISDSDNSAAASPGAVEGGGSSSAVAATAHQLQLSLGELLVHRLQHLGGELEHGCAVQQQHSAGGELQPAAVEQHAAAPTTAAGAGSTRYCESEQHAALIRQYCSSKAALVRMLADQFSRSSQQ